MIQRLDCRVVAILDATRDIRVVHLGQVDDRRLAFRAGQYAAVSFASLPPRDYSMANRPGAPLLEFHVRRMGGDGVSAYVTGRLASAHRAPGRSAALGCGATTRARSWRWRAAPAWRRSSRSSRWRSPPA